METPIYSRLKALSNMNRAPFAMPGHKNRGLADDLISLDMTEIGCGVDLLHESDEVRAANRLLGDLYGTRESFILTGGSTLAIQVMLASVLSPGDTLLASADCHKSVINTCALCGFRLRVIPVGYDLDMDIPLGIGDFEITDDVRAVLLTSPNYYGIAKDIKRAAEKCHAAGVPLLVDEAHGAHFIAGEPFPESAASQGADMVCHSAHKTLDALTGAAYLHITGGGIDPLRVRRLLRSFASSSPSYPIAASADYARARLAGTDYGCVAAMCRELIERVGRGTDIRALGNDDITRLVLNLSEYDTTGYYVNNILSQKYGIDCEMTDLHNIILITTPENTRQDFDRLYSALVDITKTLSKRKKNGMPAPPPIMTGTVSPSAFWRTEHVPLGEAVGRTAAAAVAAYPPGTAIIFPGEVIRRESVEYIERLMAAGAEPEGIEKGMAEVIG